MRFERIASIENHISYRLLLDDVEVGTIEGYNIRGIMHSVVKINSTHEGQGLGYEAFYHVFEELNNQSRIIGIAGSWNRDDEFSYCEDGMSSNLRIFRENLDKGLSRDDSAKSTPTGRWAHKLGFTTVTFHQESENCVNVTFS